MRDAKCTKPTQTAGQTQAAVPSGLQQNRQAENEKNLTVNEKYQGCVQIKKVAQGVNHRLNHRGWFPVCQRKK
jgi:hypothetical protein